MVGSHGPGDQAWRRSISPLALWITAVLSGTIDTVGFWGKPLLVLLVYAALVTLACLT